jgi:putative phosphoserine phosphatase/1-acylglycerol-3-phosphate O-acyltransferase
VSVTRTAAIFDYDGTIIAGYSIVAFLAERMRRREFAAAELLRTGISLAQRVLGRVDGRELIARAMHEWSGYPQAELETLGEQLFERELRDRIYPEIRALIGQHRRRGHAVLIATSATSFQVDAVARELGIEHVLCTRLEARDGILTGKSMGPILWGRAKADAVRDFALRHRLDLDRSYFYADGDEDVALMEQVGRPRPTNPGPGLEARARAKGWDVQRFERRGAPGPPAYLRNALATASVVPVTLGAMAMRSLTGDERQAANLLAAALPEIALGLGKVKLDVTGGENLWAARPAVFIWNHRSLFDAQIVARLVRRDFGAVVARELQSVPLIAAARRMLPITFVDGADARAAIDALGPATRLLEQGTSMIVAPEAIRRPGERLAPFKKGAFRMAMSAGVPIVPIVLRNIEDVVPRGGGALRPGTVDVAVLPPIAVTGWTRRDLDRRIESVRQQYLATLADWPGAAGGTVTRRSKR